jgi:hypothetical protein
MNVIFSREGFRALRWVYGVALTGIAVALFLLAGSYWYWQFEKNNDQQSIRAQRETNSRVDNARRELNDLRDSAQNYQQLTVRGMFLSEQRLDLIEAMQALKDRHNILDMQYTVQPQRTLNISSGNYPAVDVRASRINVKVRAYHDGDLMAFLDEFPRLQRGFFPLDRCSIQRLDRAVASATARASDSENVASPTTATNGIEAECTLEWITLRDKRNASVATQNVVGNPS